MTFHENSSEICPLLCLYSATSVYKTAVNCIIHHQDHSINRAINQTAVNVYYFGAKCLILACVLVRGCCVVYQSFSVLC